ncbi:MAG: heavy-metal-associated domain-containing protein [Prolixibacteraceae bacterium]|nr:heavy-metal-associated domain-containing protein [Prolixibacteraceae bacterium]
MDTISDGLKGILRKSPQQQQTEQFEVKMICRGCGAYIEKTVLGIEGVDYVDCNHKTGLVTVRFFSSETSLNNIELAVSNIGYDTPKYKRKVEFYTDIPRCCKHRDGTSGNDNHPRA